MRNTIAEIIKTNNLQPGDQMKDVSGNNIPDSVVLSSSMVAIKHENNYQLYHVNMITGEEQVVYFTNNEMSILKASNI